MDIILILILLIGLVYSGVISTDNTTIFPEVSHHYSQLFLFFLLLYQQMTYISFEDTVHYMFYKKLNILQI